MANAAWAFVRPFEIDKGIQSAVQAQNVEDKNAIALQEAQAELDYNKQLRPMLLQNQQQVIDHNAALRPIQLQSAQLGLEQNAALSPMAIKQAGMTLDQNTYKAIDAQTAFNASQVFRNINITPGESEDSVLMKYLEAVKGATDPAVKNAMVQQINGMASGLSIQALNRGDPVAAQNVRTLMGDAIQSQSLVGLPPAQQYAIVSNTQLTSQLPNPQVALDNAKTANEIRLRGVPTGDAIIKETNDLAGKSIIPDTVLAQEFTKMLVESQKTGQPMTMTFPQYRAMFQGNKAAPVNSVTGPTSTQGPGGVPYK